MKVVTVLGARPQFIKASAVSRAIAQSKAVEEVVVHTGQHFDTNMSDVFFAELGIAQPAYNLEIHGGTHGAMTGRMLVEVERVLLAEQPDAVLVYGDTNSTLAGALAAVKLHVPVAHVEAGLRSFDMSMPEEVNRVLTDRVARWLFTPTEAAERNLVREGAAPSQIIGVGDVMYDVALHHGARVSSENGLLATLGLKPNRYVLATIHRAENTDDRERLLSIVDALEATTEDLPVLWPVHPRTRAALQDAGRLEPLARRVTLIEPVGYLSMVQLERFAGVIATDSGGVQKEAFFHRVPCVTLRDQTEWVELVDAGWNRLAPPTDASSVRASIRSALGSRGREVVLYGQGDAATRIVKHLAASL